jgi:hypothetical protein
MNIKILGFVTLLFTTFSVLSVDSKTKSKKDDYRFYHESINYAEKLCVTNKFDSANFIYKDIFNKYENPYVSDIYIAAQFAYLNKNEFDFIYYMNLAISKGLPMEILKNTPLFNSIPEKLSSLISSKFKTYNANQNFNLSLRDSVFNLYYIEHKMKMEMGNNENKIRQHDSFEIVFRKIIKDNYLKKGIFPSEQLIGCFEESQFDEFISRKKLTSFQTNIAPSGMVITGMIPDDVSLCNYKALIPFLHYRCSTLEFKDLLWQTVLNGSLHPKDFALLLEGNTKGEFCGNKKIDENCKKSLGLNFGIISENPFEKNETPDILKINELRELYLLQSVEVDEIKHTFETKFGMRLFFGFLSLR